MYHIIICGTTLPTLVGISSIKGLPGSYLEYVMLKCIIGYLAYKRTSILNEEFYIIMCSQI